VDFEAAEEVSVKRIVTSAGAATGRTTVWSFTLIPLEFIDESNSEIVMLR